MTTADPKLATKTRDRFYWDGTRVVHELRLDEFELRSTVEARIQDDPKSAFWESFLRGGRPEVAGGPQTPLRAIDLFCGSGGLGLGIRQFADEYGCEVVTELACDQDLEALEVYTANHKVRKQTSQSVASLVDFQVRDQAASADFVYEPELIHPDESIADVDLILAGPPCQGHSNLNNRSRRDDRRNALYLTVPAFAVATRARAVIIENVPSVVHDVGRVVESTRALLENNDYRVTSGVLSAADMGWPQTRRRHFTIATRGREPLDLRRVASVLRDPHKRSTGWAIGDLARLEERGVLDQQTELSEENQRRIEWLFDNDKHDLTLHERPKSHKDGTTYTAVYGRLHLDRPAPTITTGFMSPGRGRYVHPTERRVITAHEAARIQGFPDDYQFVVDSTRPPARAKLAKWIGDAVPMPLGYAAAVSALATR